MLTGRRSHVLLCFFSFMATFVGCDAAPATPPPEPATIDESDTDRQAEGGAGTRSVYVPAYSHLGSEHRTLFAITLSVRNVDPAATVTLTQVSYYDTSGHRVRRYLDGPRRLGPLETRRARTARVAPPRPPSGGGCASR